MTSVACRSVVQSFQGLYPVYSLQTAITHTHTIGVVNSRVSHDHTHDSNGMWWVRLCLIASEIAVSCEQTMKDNSEVCKLET